MLKSKSMRIFIYASLFKYLQKLFKLINQIFKPNYFFKLTKYKLSGRKMLKWANCNVCTIKINKNKNKMYFQFILYILSS